MIDYLSKILIMDGKKTRLYFLLKQDDMEHTVTVMVDKFIQMFSVPLQKAIDNGTDPMDEIRAFDPENKLGYNNLIV
jgi:hypothetical protein